MSELWAVQFKCTDTCLWSLPSLKGKESTVISNLNYPKYLEVKISLKPYGFACELISGKTET